MTRLREEVNTLRAAGIGPESPLPVLRLRHPVIRPLAIDASVPAADRRRIGYGMEWRGFPYRLQSRYTRRRTMRPVRMLVLENEHLRAAFLPEWGGRLWSLFDKDTGRDLLYVNPVLQPANLALRDAWFSGGVEWNPVLRGHSPFTCAPLFCARLTDDRGQPVLRMYEWERVRGVPFQIDVHLPAGSRRLWIYVRLVNPHNRRIPMYWWSNIAVPDEPGHRVLAPADTALTTGYHAGVHRMRKVSFAGAEGRRLGYLSEGAEAAADYFFRLGRRARPWIAALDPEGFGLAQVSTARLRGRKCFIWGSGAGGRRWQEWLCGDTGRPYAEIQAGLARTQAECVPMPPRGVWDWMEAYGPLQIDPALAHGSWRRARFETAAGLDRLVPEAEMAARLSAARDAASRPPDEILQAGSGWGALEELRRQVSGERPMTPKGLCFSRETLGTEQAAWLELLQKGELPDAPPEPPPVSFMMQDEWRRRLEASVQDGRSRHGRGWLHLGILRDAGGDPEGARDAWEASSHAASSACAERNLGILAMDRADLNVAVDRLCAAVRREPAVVELAAECGAACLRAGRAGIFLDLFATLAPSVARAPRIRLLRAAAALAVGDPTPAERLFSSRFELPDLREGETLLTDLWTALEAAKGAGQADRSATALPWHLDFRMYRDPAS